LIFFRVLILTRTAFFYYLDKDSVIITIVPDLAELPKINLNAGNIRNKKKKNINAILNKNDIIVHASLRDNVELRPHQVEGVNTMIYMEKAYRGGILADEVRHHYLSIFIIT
jgi:SNF2 family DNA or RNA helicase